MFSNDKKHYKHIRRGDTCMTVTYAIVKKKIRFTDKWNVVKENGICNFRRIRFELNCNFDISFILK